MLVYLAIKSGQVKGGAVPVAALELHLLGCDVDLAHYVDPSRALVLLLLSFSCLSFSLEHH